MFWFRPHRSTIAEAMDEVREFESRADLEAFLMADQPVGTERLELQIRPVGYDDRIQWDTHVISVAGYGVVGFSDRMRPEPENRPGLPI